ncbi:unnamed protein product [Brassica rapa]|uniref:Uncharacterized protein n=2 Tax=Brassica TaxID=3705 RepID=A0A8D9H608_BRACM|nr:unnamed protein product [Brassica napus]CAG7893270.1 unnamed protein product [Brassica rapa]CAG7901507.1 unnamed protein product [Brassica rapa]
MIFKLKTNEICKFIDVDLTSLGEGGMLQKFYKIWWREETRVSNGVGTKRIRRQFSSACTIPSCYLLSLYIMFLATCVSYMCSDGEKLFATHTNTTCGAGPVIHSPPLDETTTAAQATVGGSSVTEPPVAMME